MKSLQLYTVSCFLGQKAIPFSPSRFKGFFMGTPTRMISSFVLMFTTNDFRFEVVYSSQPLFSSVPSLS